MSVELGIERLAAMVLLLTCLSHITVPEAWRALFEGIAKSDAPGWRRRRSICRSGC